MPRPRRQLIARVIRLAKWEVNAILITNGLHALRSLDDTATFTANSAKPVTLSLGDMIIRRLDKHGHRLVAEAKAELQHTKEFSRAGV